MINDLKEYGLDVALKAMRLPFNSIGDSNNDKIGKRDLNLAVQLIKRGGSHRKFLRFWQFWLDMEASTKFWFQFDTYKIGVTSMSESTMHMFEKNEWKGVSHEITLEIQAIKRGLQSGRLDKIQAMYMLPMGMIYHRIVSMNAEVFLRMWLDRKNHKLPEWQEFLEEFLQKSPNMNTIIEMLKG